MIFFYQEIYIYKISQGGPLEKSQQFIRGNINKAVNLEPWKFRKFYWWFKAQWGILRDVDKGRFVAFVYYKFDKRMQSASSFSVYLLIAQFFFEAKAERGKDIFFTRKKIQIIAFSMR